MESNKKQYQYKVVELKEKGLFVTRFKLQDLENELNFHGEEGWQLVSSFAMDMDSNGKKEVVLIFKREWNYDLMD